MNTDSDEGGIVYKYYYYRILVSITSINLNKYDMKTILVLAVIILIINILSLDYDSIFSLKENKTEYINIIISVLFMIVAYLKKD